jgi:hypothetical protein
VSKPFGYVLLGGVLGSVILSIALIMWVWIRSVNAPQDVVHTTPVPPTKSSQIQVPEKQAFTLVDAREQAAAATGLTSRAGVTFEAANSNGAGYISAGLESLSAACA